MKSNVIADEEDLYQSASIARGDAFRLPDGTYKISTQCFRDKTLKISVNRAIFHGHNPSISKVRSSDGVLVLIAKNVRAISLEHNKLIFSVEVAYTPIFEPIEESNLAHSEIYTKPECTKGAFEKLKASLARRARWIIEPNASQ